MSHPWKESSDEIDGPKKKLIYWRNAESYINILSFGCGNGTYTAQVTIENEDNLIDTPATATVRIGTNEPTTMKFIGKAGEMGFRPGEGSSADAKAFLDAVQGAKDVGIRFDEVLGMKSSDPAMAFKLDQFDAVKHNLDTACSA